MRQGSYKNIAVKNKDHSKGVGYKTQIVGGVIRRIPIQVIPDVHRCYVVLFCVGCSVSEYESTPFND